MMQHSSIEQSRQFLKDSVRKTIDFSRTDQSTGVTPPPVQKPYPPNAETIALVPPEEFATLPDTSLLSAIANRRSHREFARNPLTLKELSFLLWTTQGLREPASEGHARRTVPSAGARHALETYVCALNVQDLDVGFYRYLPIEHRLVVEYRDDKAGEKISRASFGQAWMAGSAAVFVWSAIPYRMEWRYGLAAHKVILLDAGHVCQNLYLACEAVNAGACAVAAYDQELIDELLRFDSEHEFAIYLAATGKVNQRS